jgi:redox-sensitive bicupin YhaK (pirin superfamily)
MKYRKVKKLVTGVPAVDGAGVHLVRVIGNRDVKDFDPFLLLDAFDSDNPDDYTRGFPWHPHRGIETVTFLVKGIIEHGDSLGHKGSIVDGGCQWMTAGSGIIHQEMPEAAPRMLGLQLWINLPAKDKMTKPKYRDIASDMIPAVIREGVRVSIIAGSYGAQNGAMMGDYIDATMLDVSLEAGKTLTVPIPDENTVFVYILEGSISFEEDTEGRFIDLHNAVLFSEGDTLSLRAYETGSARCVLFSGKPLNEPVAWGGPIVMNTREELNLAFSELDSDTFIKG